MVDRPQFEVGDAILQDLAIDRPLLVDRIVGDRGEGGLERGQPLGGGFRAGIFVLCQQDVAGLVCDGNDTLVETPLGDRAGGASGFPGPARPVPNG